MRTILNTKPDRGQAGMVAIMVTMIMALVITLIVLGFAQVSRREARQALDRNLSTEAFYAAESGINDAIDAIRSAAAGASLDKTTCNVDGVKYLNKTLQPKLDSSGGVAYTCMLVTASGLKNIVQTVSADGKSVVLPIHPANGNPLNTLHIKWKLNSSGTPPSDADINSNCAASVGSLPKAADWKCPYGVLRIDIVPTDTISRAALDDGQRTFFFYPVTGGVSVPSVSYASKVGTPQPMHCAAASCAVDITDVNTHVNYSLRTMGIYKGGTVEISGSDASGLQSLKDAQVQIDVTGRAQDVLRRLQVRIPLTFQGTSSNYAIESASSICKRFKVGDGIFSIPGDLKVTDNTNPMCVVSSVTPPAPPPSDDGNPAGDAKTEVPCADTDCGDDGTPIPPGWYFDTFMANVSTNDPSVVAGCLWDWDDGTTTSNEACNKGDTWTHYMYNLTDPSQKPDPKYCRHYNVVLTIYFNNGAPPATYPKDVYRPYGPFPEADPACEYH